MHPMFVVLVVVALIVVVRLCAGGLDRERIGNYFRARGDTLITCEWTPFGRGWFGERSDRIYAVRFRKSDGALWRAVVKTSMWTGVYLTEETAIVPALGAGDARERTTADLEQENARLRAEVERLRRRG